MVQSGSVDVSVTQDYENRGRLLNIAEKLAKIGYWRLDLASNSVYWSDAVYQLHGMEPGLGSPDLEAAIDSYLPEDRPKVRAELEQCIRTKEPFEFSLRIRLPDGAIRNVRSYGVPELGNDGEVFAIIGVFQDVTSHEDIEKQKRIN